MRLGNITSALISVPLLLFVYLTVWGPPDRDRAGEEHSQPQEKAATARGHVRATLQPTGWRRLCENRMWQRQ